MCLQRKIVLNEVYRDITNGQVLMAVAKAFGIRDTDALEKKLMAMGLWGKLKKEFGRVAKEALHYGK